MRNTNKIIKENRAKRLMQLVNEKGCTLEDVSRDAGVEYGTLMKIRDGITGNLQVRTAQRIAQYFTTDIPIAVDWIRGLDVPKYRQQTFMDISQPTQDTATDRAVDLILHKVYKRQVGKYNNVLLTDEELSYLCQRFTAKLTEKSINYKSQLMHEGKDRYQGWPSDYAALYNYMLAKEKEIQEREAENE